MLSLLLAIIFPCFIYLFYYSIQEGRIFGKWQVVLTKLYASKRFSWLENVLGGCYLCTSQWWSFAALVVSAFFWGLPFDHPVAGILSLFFLANLSTIISLIIKKNLE